MSEIIILSIVLTTTALIVYSVIKAIRSAEFEEIEYILDLRSNTMHHKSCDKVKKIPFSFRAGLDKEEVKNITYATNCRKCGGVL